MNIDTRIVPVRSDGGCYTKFVLEIRTVVFSLGPIKAWRWRRLGGYDSVDEAIAASIECRKAKEFNEGANR